MATYTTNYNLNKPTFAELADVRTFNGNMDIIDDVMNASQNSIAEPYDSTKTYDEGDMVMYELYLYKCLEETTGTWDATKWERAYSAKTGAGIVYPQDATKYLNGVGQWTVPAGGGGGVNYSTTEQVIGTWIDGSPLYQRTFHKTITNENDYIDLNGLGIDTVIFQEGYLVDDESNYKQVINAPYYNNGNYYCRLYFITNGYNALGSDYPSNPILFIESSSDSIRYYDDLIITLKYTKPTV